MAKKASSAARRRLARKTEEGGSKSPRVVTLPDGVEFFKVEEDAPKRIDILNYEITQDHNPCAKVGEEYFERTYYRHGNLGPEGKGMAICLQKTYNEPCPVCEMLKNVDWSDEEERDLHKPFNAKERQLFNVFDVADGEKGVKIWEVSYHLFGKQLDEELANADEEDEVDEFSALNKKEGKTLKVAFTEKALSKNAYYEASSINFKRRSTDHEEEGTVVYDLDKMLSHPTYDEVKAIMEGRPVASDNEPTEDEAPKKEAPKKEKKADTEGPTCPEGGEFGKDVDKFGKKCEECKMWNDCDDAANP